MFHYSQQYYRLDKWQGSCVLKITGMLRRYSIRCKPPGFSNLCRNYPVHDSFAISGIGADVNITPHTCNYWAKQVIVGHLIESSFLIHSTTRIHDGQMGAQHEPSSVSSAIGSSSPWRKDYAFKTPNNEICNFENFNLSLLVKKGTAGIVRTDVIGKKCAGIA